MSPPLAPPTGGGHCPTRRHVGADEAPLPRAAGSLPTPARPRESGVPQNCETPGSRRGAGTGLVGSSASSAPSPASPGSGGHRPCHCRKRVAGGRTCHWVDPAAEGRSADEEANPAPRKRDASAEQCGRPGPQHWGAAPLPLTGPPPPLPPPGPHPAPAHEAGPLWKRDASHAADTQRREGSANRVARQRRVRPVPVREHAPADLPGAP